MLFKSAETYNSKTGFFCAFNIKCRANYSSTCNLLVYFEISYSVKVSVKFRLDIALASRGIKLLH